MLANKKKPKRWKRPDYEFCTDLDMDTCAIRLNTMREVLLPNSCKLTLQPREPRDSEWVFDARLSCRRRQWINASLNIHKRSDDSISGFVSIYPCENPRTFWTYLFAAYVLITSGMVRIAQAAKDLGWMLFFIVLVFLPFAYDIGRSAYEKRRFYQIINNLLEASVRL